MCLDFPDWVAQLYQQGISNFAVSGWQFLGDTLDIIGQESQMPIWEEVRLRGAWWLEYGGGVVAFSLRLVGLEWMMALKNAWYRQP
jgi:hypothetical protein